MPSDLADWGAVRDCASCLYAIALNSTEVGLAFPGTYWHNEEGPMMFKFCGKI